MRQLARKISVYLFVVAFVFSGAAWAACIDLPVTSAVIATSGHHNGGAPEHGGNHRFSSWDLTAGSDQSPVQDGHIPVVKCCSMAPAANLPPSLATAAISFSDVAVSFLEARRDLNGYGVALEPEIPKPIA